MIANYFYIIFLSSLTVKLKNKLWNGLFRNNLFNFLLKFIAENVLKYIYIFKNIEKLKNTEIFF